MAQATSLSDPAASSVPDWRRLALIALVDLFVAIILFTGVLLLTATAAHPQTQRLSPEKPTIEDTIMLLRFDDLGASQATLVATS